MNALKRFQIFKQWTGFADIFPSTISRSCPVARFFSIPSSFTIASNTSLLNTNKFLTPTVCNTTQVCGMKVKGRVRKRCKDCYIVYKDHRVFNYCRSKPKHNQMNKVEKEKEYFILTGMTHGRVRKY